MVIFWQVVLVVGVCVAQMQEPELGEQSLGCCVLYGASGCMVMLAPVLEQLN